MTLRSYGLLSFAFLVFLGACATVAETAEIPTSGTPTVSAEVFDVVRTFGSRLQQVSLLSPTVVEDLQREYAGLVSPALLAQWSADPASAPGRLTSSPWPDRIEILAVECVSASRCQVMGEILEMTSAEIGSDGSANRLPIRLIVEDHGEGWLITEFEQSTPAS